MAIKEKKSYKLRIKEKGKRARTAKIKAYNKAEARRICNILLPPGTKVTILD